jgi:uncharacterized protein with NAD-binding domain and iron-sulfur cluster
MLGFTGGVLQWVFDRGRIGGTGGLLAAVISASGEHEALSRESLIDRIQSELRAVLGPQAKPHWSQVITEKRATFSCVPRLERPEGTTPLPGLLLAGDYVATDYPGTLEAAVRSGVAAGMRALGPL